MMVLLSGPIAVGKTSVREKMVADFHFEYVRSGRYLSALAQSRKAHGGRTDLQELGDELDKLTDYRWIIDDVAKPAILAQSDRRRWLVDAVRKQPQVQHFRLEFGRATLHVHLTAHEDVLRERYCSRQRSTGELTPYERAVSHDNEAQSRALIDVADIVVDVTETSAERVAHVIMEAFSARGVR